MASDDCRFGSCEALPPDFHERIQAATIRRFERGEISSAFVLTLGFESDRWKVKPTQKFAQEQPNDAAIEILERVNGEEAPFGKGEKLNSEFAEAGGGLRPPGLKVEAVVMHP